MSMPAGETGKERDSYVNGLLARAWRWQRVVAAGTGLVMACGLAAYGEMAGAAPQPTVAQVQAKINRLTSQFDKVSQQLDQAGQQLATARTRLSQVRLQFTQATARFHTAQANVAQAAAAAFEDTGTTSIAGVLTSGNPAAVLQQGSLLQELSSNRTAQTRQLLTQASHLADVEQQVQRTESGIAALKGQLADHKKSLGKLITAQKATLASLTVPQQQVVASQSIGANGSSAPQQYNGSTSTQAGKAVAFAYAQLGKPYEWGATGPDAYDCSGLVQAAWAAAGVSIPRTTYDQWASLPHVSSSALEPGDLLFFDSIGHVAIYVGGGYMIDAPRTGLDVEKVSINTDWYKASFDGATRP
jgi:peptidoglycan DL-endopeptidase CwlO